MLLYKTVFPGVDMKRIQAALLPLFILCAVTAVSCSTARTNDSSTALDRAGIKLPQQFTGTFRWEGVDEIQRLVINLYDVKTEPGIITATGKGTYYTAGVVTIINIRISINTSTGFFEMWESNPDRDNGFITQGSHTGAISPDLRRIEAVWTTSGTGERGRLELTAAGPGN